VNIPVVKVIQPEEKDGAFVGEEGNPLSKRAVDGVPHARIIWVAQTNMSWTRAGGLSCLCTQGVKRAVDSVPHARIVWVAQANLSWSRVVGLNCPCIQGGICRHLIHLGIGTG